MFAIIRTRWQTRPLSRRAKRRSSTAPGSLRKKYAGMSIPQTWYALLLALPHLEIIGSRYKYFDIVIARYSVAYLMWGSPYFLGRKPQVPLQSNKVVV